MNTRVSLLSAAILSLVLCSPAGATTTTYKFCSDSSDSSTYTANTNAAVAAGWIISNPGAVAAVAVSPYSYPIKFNSGTYIISPSCGSGSFITKIIVGARVSATTAELKVTPYSNGVWGTAETKALSDKGKLEEIDFVFSSSEEVTKVKIEFTATTGYVYYTSVKTLIPLDSPVLALDGDAGESEFTVGWNTVTDAEGYSVKLVGPNSSVVWSNNVDSATTTKTFTGLSSSTQYSVSVVALGDYDTTDDSAPATLQVTTDASSVAAPTLVVSNTSSWIAGTAGTSAVSATLEGNVACAVESVSMSDGSTATVANGTLSWTPPFSATASTVTATFYVTHDGLNWYLDEDLSVAATPAPSAPVISFSGTTSKAFTASWTATEGGPVSSYKVRAWTGRATPDDATGSTTEYFTAYRAGGSIPADWSTSASLSSAYASDPAPVKFDKNIALFSPVYPGTLSSLSFVVKQNGTATGSTFSVYGSSGEENAEYELMQSYDATTFSKGDAGTTETLSVPAGVHQFKFDYARSSANVGFGSFEVSGTDWPAADFLEGWGGAKVSVGSATSQTFSNPVPGELNYVEVTAVGPAGSTTSFIASVAVPGRPSVIAVK